MLRLLCYRAPAGSHPGGQSEGPQHHAEALAVADLQLLECGRLAEPLVHGRQADPRFVGMVVQLERSPQLHLRIPPAPLGAREQSEQVPGEERLRRRAGGGFAHRPRGGERPGMGLHEAVDHGRSRTAVSLCSRRSRSSASRSSRGTRSNAASKARVSSSENIARNTK